MSSSESDVPDTGSQKRKGRNPANYKVNKIKAARLKGEAYVNHRGKNVPCKMPEFSCRCKKKCLEVLGEDNCLDVFTRLHNINTKNEQDVYIQGLIDILEVKRWRPRSQNSTRVNSATFKYHVLVGSLRTEVCLDAFVSVFNITVKRLRKIRELKIAGKTPEDKRGLGATHTLSFETHDLIRQHIESFPLRESHYLGQTKFYLSADLKVKLMWKLFKVRYQNLQEIVSYYTYWNVFRKHFNCTFGRPQMDTCCTCEDLNLKIKSPHLNPVAKRAALAELMVHERRSKKFYDALRHEASDLGKADTNVLSLSFDYMQNISLPKTPVQEIFYLRELTINLFCIHNIKSNLSTLYVYHEGEGRKSPNEVCSFLSDYLKEVADTYTELRLFSDNCSAQNKNQALCRYLLALTDTGRFQTVQQFFPVRGHSFPSCDRDFGVIKRKLQRQDRIYSIHEIIQYNIESSKPGKFIVKKVDLSEIIDYKNWWKNFYRKTAISTESQKLRRDEKVHFGNSSLFHLVFSREKKGHIQAYTHINGLIHHTFYFSVRPNQEVVLPDKPAYSGKVPMNETNIKDIRKLIQYVPVEYQEFYNEILQWPVTICNTCDQ